MEETEEIIVEELQVPLKMEDYHVYLLKNGTIASIPKKDLIYLIKVALPDITFLGDGNEVAKKFETILKGLE